VACIIPSCESAQTSTPYIVHRREEDITQAQCAPTCPPECWIQCIGPVCGANDDHMALLEGVLLLLLLVGCCSACLSSISRAGGSSCRRRCEVVHARQHLRHNAALHFALGGLTLRRDSVDLINENDGWRNVDCLL